MLNVGVLFSSIYRDYKKNFYLGLTSLVAFVMKLVYKCNSVTRYKLYLLVDKIPYVICAIVSI